MVNVPLTGRRWVKRFGLGVLAPLGALAVLAPSVMVANEHAAERPSLIGRTAAATDGTPLDGVAVSARAAGSTITTTVFSDESGQYLFPRLPEGRYRVWAQAVGYKTATADVAIDGPLRSVDLSLEPLDDVAPQLSGSEWLASLPTATKEQRRMKEIFRVNCTKCHSAALTLQSRFDEAGWRAVIDMMLRINRTDAATDVYSTIKFHRNELAKYLASVRGPDSPPLHYKLNPRPRGDAARVVITEYDIPISKEADGLAWFNGSDWSAGTAVGGDRGNPIHDVVVDNDGIAWITAHGLASTWGTLVRLDPGTGKVTGYAVKGPDGRVQGSHTIKRDANGILWFNTTPGSTRLDPKTQEIPAPGLARFDPRTEEIRVFIPPANIGGGRGVSLIPDVDGHGKVWVNTNYGALRFDPDAKKWMYLRTQTVGAGYTYASAGDSEGNGWWTLHVMDRVGKGDPATGRSYEVVMRPPWMAKEEDVTTPEDREFYETMGALTWGNINFVPGAQMPRRIAADKNGPWVWVANHLGNNLARINVRSLKTDYYRLPMPGSAYGVDVDKDHNAWVHLHGDDTVGKLNPRTGAWTIYQLPSRGCSPRDLRVDDLRGEVWAACREAARVARLQFRTAPQLDALKRQAAAARP